MPAPKTRLKNVALNEVSFVDAGDNPEAHILLLKMKPGPVESVANLRKDYKGDRVEVLQGWAKARPQAITKEVAAMFNEILQNQTIRNKIWDMVWSLEDSISSIMGDDKVTSKGEVIAQTVDQFRESITALTKGEGTMPAELKKQLEEAQNKVKQLEDDNKALTTKNTELEGSITNLTEEVNKLKGDKGTADTTIDKSKLSPEVAAFIEKQEKESEQNRQMIEKMQDETLTATMVAKAAAIPHIGESAELTKTLKKLHKMDPEVGEAVFGLLKKADAAIRHSKLLAETGEESTSEDGTTAVDLINKEASELVKANPSMTHEAAFAQVYRTNTELAKRYRRENKVD